MMMTITKNIISKRAGSFQVTDSQGLQTWVPYSMVFVVREVEAKSALADAGSITFEIGEALATRLNLVDRTPEAREARTGIIPVPSSLGSLEIAVPGSYPVHRVQPRWEFTVDEEASKPTVGRYTIVLSDEDDYVTLRVSEWDSRPGVLILSFLKGPDNANDYLPFAEFNPDRRHYRTWKTFRHGAFSRYAEAAWVLLSLDENGQYGAGEAYALHSGNCCKCGRDLTVAKSIKRGMGPDCWMRFAPMDELRQMVERMRFNA